MALSAKIGAHELGHLVGLRHQDSFGPIGYGIHAPPGPGAYNPDYPGPSAAYETFDHLIGSPATIGSNRFNDIRDLYWGEREAVKLAFIAGGTMVVETAATQSGIGSSDCTGIILSGQCRVGQDLGGLAQLVVPNTLDPGVLNAGKQLHVAAIAVVGPEGSSASISIDPTGRSQSDFYTFDGLDGELVNIEVTSNGLTRLGTMSDDLIDPVLRVYDSAGLLVAYFDGAAINDDQFEPTDSSMIDLRLPSTGKYYLEVDTFARASGDPICSDSPGNGGPLDPNNLQSILNPSNANFNSDLRERFLDTCNDTDTGEYELFIYRFDTATDDVGDVLRGGAGADLLLGGGGLDDLKGGPGFDEVSGGSADDDSLYVITVDAVTSDAVIDEGQSFSGSGSFTDPGGDSWTATVDYGDNTGPQTLPLLADKSFALGHIYANNGAYTIVVTVTSDDGLMDQDTLSVVVENVAPTVALSGPAGASEGAALHYTFSTSDPGADTFGLVATSGGSVGTVSNVVFNPATGSGSFDVTFSNDTPVSTVSMQVRDSDNALSNVASINVDVDNVAPVVNAGADAVAFLEGGTAFFAATGSFVDPGSDTWTATVNYGDGPQVLSLTGKTFSLARTYTGHGAFTVEVCVSDGIASHCDSLVVNVPAVQLSVQITGLPPAPPDPNAPKEGSPITLGSTSTPAATGNVTYGWSVLRNGQLLVTGVSPSFSFTPDDEGSYVVTVSVAGSNGAGTSPPATILVENVAPTVNLSGPSSAFEGDTIHYTFTTADPGADTFTIFATSGGAAGIVSNVVFNSVTGAGSFDVTFSDDVLVSTVSVQVEDSDDALSNVATIDVNVVNVKPQNVNAGNDLTVNEGATVNLRGSFTDPGALDSHLQIWSVSASNGQVIPDGSGADFSFVPTDDGIYTVTYTVTDDNGNSSDTLIVTVNNVAPQNVNAGPNQSVFEGDTVLLSGSFTDPGSVDGHTEVWSVTASNGQVIPNVSGPIFSFKPHDNGTYTVTYTVTDDDGGITSDSATIAVSNVAPVFKTDQVFPPTSEGTPISLDASKLVLDAGQADQIVSHPWIVTRGGIAFGNTSTAETFNFTPDDNGAYLVTLTVQDDDGAFASRQYSINVSNADPVPTINGVSALSPEGTTINLTSSIFDPGSADTHSRSWSVSATNGQVIANGSGVDFSFEPNDNGEYLVSLTATDDDYDPTDPNADSDGRRSITQIITVSNIAPTASITGAPASPLEGTPISLGSVVTDQSDPDTAAGFTYAWSVTKNGAAYGAPATGANFTFTPDDNGTYEVKLQATDKDLAAGNVAVRTIQVINVAPRSVNAGPDQTVAEGSRVTLSGSFSDPGSADTHTFQWHLITAAGPQLVSTVQDYLFGADDEGAFTYRLTVMDDDGDSSSDIVIVSVIDRPPVPIISGDATTLEGAEYVLSLSAENASGDPITSWIINWGDAEIQTVPCSPLCPPSVTHTYIEGPNSFTISGLAAQGSKTYPATPIDVDVLNVVPVIASITGASLGGVAEKLSFSATFSDAGISDTHTCLADWGDNTSTVGTVSEIEGAGTCSASHVYVGDGSFTIKFTVTDDDGDSAVKSMVVAINRSIIALDPAVCGALTMSGNAVIDVDGNVVVHSSCATSAIAITDKSRLDAAKIFVRGGAQATGKATFSTPPMTNLPANDPIFVDPLSSLTAPTLASSASSVNCSGSTHQTLDPGRYSQIKASSNCVLTLKPGVYIVESGGFEVSGFASVKGQTVPDGVDPGVVLYNVSGSINLSGYGSFTLTAPLSGPYGGVLIFQARGNTKPLSFSGNASGMRGTVYAPTGQVTVSGEGKTKLSFISNTIRLSGNAATSLTAGAGPAEADASAIMAAGQLKTGLFWVSIEQQSIDADPQRLARIRDAIRTVNQTFAPYGVTLVEVDAATSDLADVRIIVGPTSPCGDKAQGVLGCATVWGEITLIEGWNWYSGADQALISSQQFDLQTIITHELGHAVAVDHSSDPNSTMYSHLAAGEARREFTAIDLAILADPNASDDHEANSLMVPLLVEWQGSRMFVDLAGDEHGEQLMDIAGEHEHCLISEVLLDNLFSEWDQPASGRLDGNEDDHADAKQFLAADPLLLAARVARRSRKLVLLDDTVTESTTNSGSQEQQAQDEALLDVVAEWIADSN